jgi:MFS family permease
MSIPKSLEKGVLGPEEPPIVPEVYSIFTKWQKVLIVTIVSLAATFSSFSGNIYYPSLPNIAVDLSVSSELVNLTVTSYMVFQGLAPQIWSAIADVKGRRITYIVTFIIFFGACVGLAETKAYSQLLVLRCLQSTGSASTIAIGAGVIGDITKREERGGYMGIFQAGLLVPNAAGPVRLSCSVINFYAYGCARFLEGCLLTPWDGGPSSGSWQYIAESSSLY